jgi:hypothetical protein
VQPGEFEFTAYGALRLHPWAATAYAEGSDRDLFILVANQAAALGLSAFDGRSQGLQWHPFADSADRWTAEQPPGLVFRCGFQTDDQVTGLPLQSAGLVLQQAVDRIGALELERLDVRIGRRDSDPLRFVDGRDWFEFSAPGAVRPGRIALPASTAGLPRKTQPWLGRTVEFGQATGDGWEVTVRSTSLDFLAWVSGVLAWACADDDVLVRFGFGQDTQAQASSS